MADSNIDIDNFIKNVTAVANMIISKQKTTLGDVDICTGNIALAYEKYITVRDGFKQATSNCAYMIDRHKIAAFVLLSLLDLQVIQCKKDVTNPVYKMKLNTANLYLAFYTALHFLRIGIASDYNKQNLTLSMPKVQKCKDESAKQYEDLFLTIAIETSKHLKDNIKLAANISHQLFLYESLSLDITTGVPIKKGY